MTHEERLALAIEFNKQWIASKHVGKIATEDMIKADELTPEEVSVLVALYPKWGIGVAYAVGDLISYDNGLFEVVQAHTSQVDWLPNITPALYKAKTPINVIPEWVQPTGSHDAYNIGDKVMFEGKIYESLINGNVWNPTAYPQGWQLVTG